MVRKTGKNLNFHIVSINTTSTPIEVESYIKSDDKSFYEYAHICHIKILSD